MKHQHCKISNKYKTVIDQLSKNNKTNILKQDRE